MNSTELRPDEVAANRCFEKHGLRITRENGEFELKGNLNAGQDAYFDPSCNELIGPDIQRRVQRFFRGVDAQIVDCLKAKGYAATLHKWVGFNPAGAPMADLRECTERVRQQYQ